MVVILYQWRRIRQMKCDLEQLRRRRQPQQQQQEEPNRPQELLAENMDHDEQGKPLTSQSPTPPIKATSSTFVCPFRPIGTVRSVFRLCVGTPRQGMLAKHARGRVDLDPTLLAPDCLAGLDSYSHVWVIFLFHLNTNVHVVEQVDAAAAAVANADNTSLTYKQMKLQKKGGHRVFPSKVSPPALGGEKVGIFSTRTPHRLNPIGLSLCKLEGIETYSNGNDCNPNSSSGSGDNTNHKKGGGSSNRFCIHISGIDLV